MPLQRRLPKRGFTNIFRKEYEIVNVGQIAGISGVDEITPEVLKERGLIRSVKRVKILGEGELTTGLAVKAHKFSKSAIEKIEKSGGKIETL